MGVILREKKLSKGGVSFYLDISHDGKRWYEFLKILAYGNRRSDEFLEKKKLAETARSTREYRLTVERVGIPDETKREKDFYAFLLEKASHMKTPRHSKYLITLLTDFTGSDTLAMSELTKEFIVRFQDFLIKRKLHPNNCYGIVHNISTAINKAITDGYMNENPFSKIPKAQRFRLQKAIPKFLTLEQIEHLAKTGQGIPDELKLAFFLCCFCGVRWVDCYGLKWEQFTSQKIDGEIINVLYIHQEKTNVGVYIPLSEQALSILKQRKEMAKKESPSSYVFPFLCQSPSYTSNYSRMAFYMKKWQKQSGIHVHFHKARHSFATLTLSEGADLYTVSKLLGHSDIKHTMIYARVVDRLKIAAVARLPKLNGELLVSVKAPQKTAGNSSTKTPKPKKGKSDQAA
jgi:integrase